MVDCAAEHTQWLEDQLKGDKGAMSYSMIKGDLLPRFQARFPSPQRTIGSLYSHITRNATIRNARGLDLLVNKSHAIANANERETRSGNNGRNTTAVQNDVKITNS